MQPSDEVLDAALAAPQRDVAQSTRLGGRELGPQVQSWKVERAYNTDLPEAMRAVSGSASAQLELQLSGADGVPAPRMYSAWADRATGDVARPGQSVVHSAGLTGRMLPAFRGTVRSRSADSGSDTVTVQALDGAERLRGPASLPRPYHGVLYGRPVATATWCVDELLRQGGIHTCPPPRAPELDKEDADPFTVLYASLHGGFNASYGQPETVPAPSAYDWVREGAPFEMALMPKEAGLTVSWMPRSRFVLPGSIFQVECWVNTALSRGSKLELKTVFDRSAGASGHLTAVFDTSSGAVTITSGTVGGTSGTWTWNFPKLASAKGRWHLGFMADATGTGTSVIPSFQPRLTAPDGGYLVGGKSASSTNTNAAQPQSELNRVDVITDMAVECVQVTDRIWTDTAGYPAEEWEQRGRWSKGAALDEAALPLYDVPKVSGSLWEAITEIARASMSTAEFDEFGVFRWRGPKRFQTTPTEPDLTLTTLRDIASLTVGEEIDACRNYCEQPYKDWSKVTSVLGTVVDDPTKWEIPPGGSREVSYAVAEDENDFGPPVVDDDVTPIKGGSKVRFGTAVTGGKAVKGAVTVSTRRQGPLVILRFTNRGTAAVWTVTKDGKGSVHLETIKSGAEPKQRSYAWFNTDSQKYYGKQQYLAEASDWVQDRPSASDLSFAMLDAGRYPMPLLGEVEVLHDPRVQLGDAVRVVDSAGAALDTLAWVVGIRTTATAGSAPQQVLTLRGASWTSPPRDEGLVPDPPLDPNVGRQRPYTEVTAAYDTLADLLAKGIPYRALKQYG
ncbi:hypothetical protein ACFYYR_24490 [Streptomyces sp. NPDC001922]|uniref:hypothetical protein n=1 Tax=Streptomyces sp. NPDC001922 TaxID=3364624 RepID=UPI00369D39BB